MNSLLRAKKHRIEHHVHFYVLKMATDLCMASYEVLMKNDKIFAEHKRRHPGFSPKHLELAFVKRYLAAHVAPARAILAQLLATTDDEELKRTIHEALVADNFLTRGRDPKGWGLPPKGNP